MNRPDKIKIGYKEYKLEEWKQTVASANEAQGQFFAKEGIIGYTGDETGVSHANTLIHEILHAIIYQWNMDLDEKIEESVVNGLANGLTTIFVDNPKLQNINRETLVRIIQKILQLVKKLICLYMLILKLDQIRFQRKKKTKLKHLLIRWQMREIIRR